MLCEGGWYSNHTILYDLDLLRRNCVEEDEVGIEDNEYVEV